jgi:hypothetical protein
VRSAAVEAWLQTHLEIVKDLLLVGLRNGDFVELDFGHEDLLAADVNSFGLRQACLLDVRQLRPAGAAVNIAVLA